MEPAPATALPDELTEEVFLRIHPAAAATLVRAAAVCKRWRRLIADPVFRRRFRAFHRTPHMLGFSCNITRYLYTHSSGSFYDRPITAARFVRTSSSCLKKRADLDRSRVVDARHGRVLLHVSPEWYAMCLLVWDPITKEEHTLPSFGYRGMDSWNAAVFCTGAGCDHLDCHGKTFAVVFVATGGGGTVMFNLVYSSQTAGWESREVTYPCDDAHLVLEPSALVGNALYFVLETKARILKYNISTREMHMVQLPPAACCPERRIVLMATEDDNGRLGLGFATVRESKLYLWSMEGGSDSDKDARWAQRRVIDLEALLPGRALVTPPDVVGFAQGVGLIFVKTKSGHFRIDLKSSWVKRVRTVGGASNIFPCMSFHTPALGATAAFTGEG